MSLGPLLAIAAGAALAVARSVALLRTGLDETWFRARIEVLDADHIALPGRARVEAAHTLMATAVLGTVEALRRC